MPKQTDYNMASRDPKSSPLAQTLNEAELADEQSYDAMAPTGKFSAKALNALVKSTNKILPLFGQTPDYPTFSQDITKFPTDFVRVLGMISQATKDAAAAEAITPDMVVSLDNLTDDRSLLVEAGRLDALSKNKDFKSFLKEPKPADGLPPEEEEDLTVPADEAADMLFAERL